MPSAKYAHEVDYGLIIDGHVGIFAGIADPNTIADLDSAPAGSRYFLPDGTYYIKQTSSWVQPEDSGTDHHAGWHKIIPGQVVQVSERKQMRINGTLQNAGILVINGILVID